MRAAISIDSASAVPVYRQVYEAWRQGILNGRFARGSRVPSTRELADSLDVARSTVSQAYEQLIAEGYLLARQGSGTFVCDQLPETSLYARRAKRRPSASPRIIQLSSYGLRLSEDLQYLHKQPGWISFAHWWPDQATFPTEIWRRSMQRRLRATNAEVFTYASDSQGYEPLRREIAAYLARFRAVSCTPEQVVVVNGSQQGLDLCARLLVEPGDGVAMENPGYLGIRRILLAAGAKIKPVAVDEQGIATDALDARARLVYTTPSHQFPTGVALSLQRRLALIAWAQAHGAVIIEDDYDSEYRYSGAPLPALQGLISDAPVIYCGTFSKVMFPGLRIGYLVVPPALAPTFRRAKWLTDRNTPILEQAALADFIREGHLERHIRRMRRLYASRREAFISSLRRHFGSRATVLGEAAGMHAFVAIDDKEVRERAARNKVHLRGAEDYYLGSAPRDKYVFGFATLTDRMIREGVKRLAP
jgi:GntR family transcriptional regulator / MocR family aminotransferase